MKENLIANQFARMGARFKIAYQDNSRLRDYALDIRRDHRGEFFEMLVPKELEPALEVCVMQTLAHDRHLLLLVKKPESKDRFLCGHDEREWFVAAVPGGASSVAQARDALKPDEVRAAENRVRLKSNQRNRRHNRAFIRQGEWFFVPADLSEAPGAILRNEPIRRGAGKAHMVAEVCRFGGEEVYVCGKYPNGITAKEYHRLVESDPKAKKFGWRRMMRNPGVYARGRVRHPDHCTIVLRGWHRVLMNTETQSRTMANLAFLD
ncbi:MAG: hypothetical protein ACOYM3_28290 [Terrimicrobiaceae bacterium]